MGAIVNSGIWNRFFDDLVEPVQNSQSTSHIPDVAIQKSDDTYRVVVPLPGMKKENLSINVEDGFLKIAGKYEEEASDKFETVHREYFRYTEFNRRLKLDESRFDLDKIDARLEDGVLTVEMPLTEKEKPKQIEINVN